MNSENILKVENLSLSLYDENVISVLRNISFSLKKGQTLGLVGESGSGKSLTSLAIMRLLSPLFQIQSGNIWFHKTNLLNLTENKMNRIRGKKISMIFQNPISSLNPTLTIGQQLSEVLKAHDSIFRKNKSAKEINDISCELLKKVGISDPKIRLKSYPHQMSGGMCQRIVIAQSIGAKPEILIADEPTTALDVTIQAQILRLLKDIQNENQLSMLLISHDLALIGQNSHDIIVMYSGEVIEYGPTRIVLKNPHHPYTLGLIKSLHRDKVREKLWSIPGNVPTLKDRPKGCSFHPRCFKAQDICRKENPPWTESLNSRGYKCFFPEIDS
jgi:peptide/nickel transport system ATP-binding protein